MPTKSGKLKKRPYLNFPGVFLSSCACADGLCAAGAGCEVRELPGAWGKPSLLPAPPGDTETCRVCGAVPAAPEENSA